MSVSLPSVSVNVAVGVLSTKVNGSLDAVTLTVMFCGVLLAEPSLTVMDKVRLAVGVSSLL